VLVHLIDKLYLYTMKTSNTELNDQVVISRGEYNELLSIKSDCEYLRFQLSELKRMLYGVRSERFRSEKTDDGQLDLFAGTRDSLRDIQPKAEANKETITYEREKPVRSRLPEHLRREEEVIEPDLIPDGAVKIGESVTELLEYKPADVYVRVIIRPKYVVPGTEGEGCVTVAPMPSLPIVKGNAGAGILSHICASKFIDHLRVLMNSCIVFIYSKLPQLLHTANSLHALLCTKCILTCMKCKGGNLVCYYVCMKLIADTIKLLHKAQRQSSIL
jgi:transposase